MKKTKVAIVDYGSGNIYSVQRALEYCGAEVSMAISPADVLSANVVVLPGVGAFEAGMQGLASRGFVDALRQYAATGRPLLGICLGMQMLASSSREFGIHAGLDLIPGEVVEIPSTDVEGHRLKVPHIGWATLHPPHGRAHLDPLFGRDVEGASMYLVHSYHFLPCDSSALLASYVYGGHSITAAIRRKNITGLQFHPEKSAETGLQLLSEYLKTQFT